MIAYIRRNAGTSTSLGNNTVTSPTAMINCECDTVYITGEIVYVEESVWHHTNLDHENEKFLASIKIASQVRRTRRVIRDGVKTKFDVPKMKCFYKPELNRKMPRCNRKGIGLRLRKSR